MFRHEGGDPDRCVVLLPGVRYLSQAPLLWYSREAAQARGFSVVELDERAPGERDPEEWIRERAEAALREAAGAELVVVLGKSLGSLAAPLVSGPAIWLTPLLGRSEVADSLAATEAPTLLVGSSGDPTWTEGTVPENARLEVMELAGLDHSLQVSGDPLSSLDVLRDVTRRVGGFLDSLG